MSIITRSLTIADRTTAFSDQSEELSADSQEFAAEIEIPEDLTTLSDDELSTLQQQATEAFDAMYGAENLSDEDYETLAELTEGIEALQAEIETRQAAQAELAAKAEELAKRIGRNDAAVVEEVEELAAEEVEEAAVEVIEEPEVEAVAASAAPARTRSIRVPMASVRREAAMPVAPVSDKPSIKNYLVASGDGLGQPVGQGIDFLEAGQMLDRRLNSFGQTQYEAANRAGRQISERHSLVSIQRPIPEDLQIRSNDPDHVREVFDRATDESRLKGGSLVAAGGWCAPSEVLYELGDEFETREGLLSIPEIGVPRGGISFTTGIDFRDLYTQVAEGAFSFTEEDDADGKYKPNDTPGEGNVVGDKPCFRIECPDFQEYRLDVDGLCVTAGLLQSRGYPEVQARTLRGILVAHDHLLNGKMITQMVNGSTAVSMVAGQAGTAAPVLSAIELQTEHYRASRRMARNTTLEAVFPFWVRGAIRADLSRRLGVELFDINDQRIDGWFRLRGINAQFVYNWQPIDATAAGSLTSWPSSVSFLLYAAGTWVKGINDIITIDTLYDSVLLGQNDFTALFTEEGWFVAQRGQDSRVVTTSICTDGATHAGIAIECNGSASAIPGTSEENPIFTSEVTGD